MFTPDPTKSQEPVFLAPGTSLVLHTKPFTPPASRGISDNIIRLTVQASAVRFRTDGEEVKVAMNFDPHAGPPTKFFLAKEGIYPLGGKIESISLTAPARGRAVIYLEIA